MSKLNKKRLIVLSIGLFVITAAQITGHFFPALPDVYKGAMVGLGIGMMLVAFMKRSSARTNR